MYIALDFGGSTIDLLCWQPDKLLKKKSFERYPCFVNPKLEDFLKDSDLIGVKKIFVTGGKARFLANSYKGVKVVKVGEIEAIGRGGAHLIKNLKGEKAGVRNEGSAKVLVVSMGTGTCMVEIVQKNHKLISYKHVGGTGVGGGTFLGLCASLLKVTDIDELKKMFKKGQNRKVDLLVKDIIGGDIGLVPGDATASNLAKLSREIAFSRNDLASGIVNLIGQTIGITAVFAAKAHDCDLVLLTGKLTLIKEITDIVIETGKMYGLKMAVPKDAEFVSAFGALNIGMCRTIPARISLKKGKSLH